VGNTNQLLFPCSYYYYEDFYADSPKVSDVTHPVQKTIIPCFAYIGSKFWNADANPILPSAHGKGLDFLFVDGHSQFAQFLLLAFTDGGPPPKYGYNYDNVGLTHIDLLH
jgi:prepilin-type processing-associated H-X9-DG protein